MTRQHLFILLSAIVGIIIALAPLPLQPQAQLVLAIMIVAMFLWFTEALPLHATAIVIAFLLITIAGMTPEETFTPFFDPVIVLLLGGFVLARALQKHKLDEYIAYTFLDKIGHAPNTFLFAMMVIAAFLSMWMSNTAATAILLPIGLVVLTKNKIKPLKSNYGKALVLGIAFAATIGGIGTLIGSTPNVIAAKFLNEAGIAFDFLDWMWYGLPFVIVFIPVAWVVVTRIFRSEIKTLKTIRFKRGLSKPQKQVLLIFAVTVALWLTTRVHGMASSTVSLVPIILLYVFGLLNTEDFTKIHWPTLILIGGGLSLGLAIQASGLDAFIASFLELVIANQPLFLAFVGIGFFAILLTVVASNTAAAAVMIPLMIPLAHATGLDVTTVVMLAAIGVSLDFIVPVGTPPSAIAYSSGYIRVKDMAKAGAILATISLFVLASLAMLYWI
ncbi:MAG: DASS family sodium-coupled anion symporter [Nanoarchaeota archaeon]|nr:DASS family sodium-coupled anion symporter [Nanoarchaeota archaeon]